MSPVGHLSTLASSHRFLGNCTCSLNISLTQTLGSLRRAPSFAHHVRLELLVDAGSLCSALGEDGLGSSCCVPWSRPWGRGSGQWAWDCPGAGGAPRTSSVSRQARGLPGAP